MTRYRRSRFAVFAFDDSLSFDPVALLRGEPPTHVSRARIIAASILTGKRHDLTPAELEVLGALPAERWSDPNGMDAALLDRLVECGFVISDAPAPVASALRDRDKTLSETALNRDAALYHYMTQWTGVALVEDHEGLADAACAAARRHAAAHGPVPGLSPRCLRPAALRYRGSSAPNRFTKRLSDDERRVPLTCRAT